MDIIIISTIILVVIVCLLFYFLQYNHDKNSSIPYVTYGSYPIIGHLFPFIRDRTKFLIECHQRYGQCFKIRIFNQYLTFIVSPCDWITINRNQFFYFPLVEQIQGMFDLSLSVLDHPELDIEIHRQYVQYLKNRDSLQSMTIEFVRRIRQLMQQEKMSLKNNDDISKWIPTGLLEFSYRMIFQPSTLTLFGEVEPLSIVNDFRLFDNKIHYFSVNLPQWIYSCFLPEEVKARSRLNKLWLKDLYPSRESEFMQARKILFLSNSDWFTKKDLSACQTGIFWASLTNTIPAVFWCLFYLLQDTKAVEIIQQEIDTYLPRFSIDNNEDESVVEEWTLDQLNSCIYLESAINEVLRLTSAPLLMRKCRQETEIILEDGRILFVKPNETFVYFTGINHLNTNFFPEPHKFIFDRFINTKPEHVHGFMPFGKGKSMCPGQFYVKDEMKICIAMLLRYLEYKFIDTEKIPTQNPYRVGFGVAPPNQDVSIMYRYKI